MSLISVALFIESESHDVQSMNSAIGVSSDKSWRKGDPRGRTGKVYLTDSWLLATKRNVENDVWKIGDATKAAVNDVLSKLQGHEAAFREVSKWGTSALRVNIVSELLPPFVLDPSALKQISELGIELEVEIASY